MNNKLLLPHLAVLAVNLIYGINHFVAKGVMPDYLSPNFFIFIRILGACSLFWMVRFFYYEKIDRKDYPLIALCGLCGIAMNQLFFFHGLSRTSPVDSAIIMTTTPILVTIFSFLILKNKITFTKILGVSLGLIGAVYLVYLGAKDSEQGSSLLGNLFILINATSYGVYIVIVKPLMKKYKPITVITMVFTFGSLYILPFGIYSIGDVVWEIPSDIILAIGYVLLFSTFATYLLNIYGISRLQPTIIASYIYLQPVFAMILAWLLSLYYNDQSATITPTKIGATLLIFVGVYLVSKTNKQTVN